MKKDYRIYRDPNIKIETKADLKSNVKEWYSKMFKDDPLKENIKEDLTFQDVVNALNENKDIYSTIGIGDSIIRERIFKRLTELTKLNYDVFYYKWLGEPDEEILSLVKAIKDKGILG